MDTTRTSQVNFSTVYNDFKEALSGMGEALKVGAEHVYEVIVKQQIVNSVTWLLIILVLCVISTFFWKGYLKANSSNKRDCYSIVAIIVTIITTLVFFCTIQGIVTGFINPEYGAMLDISNFIK